MERRKRRVRLWDYCSIVRVLVVLGLVLSVGAQAAPFDSPAPSPVPDVVYGSEKFESRSVARLFYQRAFALTYSGGADKRDLDEAVVYLVAARNLDPSLTETSTVLFDLVVELGDGAYDTVVFEWLLACPAPLLERLSARRALRYLLEQQKHQAARESLLLRLQQEVGEDCPIFLSELQTHLGLVALQRPKQRNAQAYFQRALERNPYNKVAFSHLAELAPEAIPPGRMLEKLRLAVRANPLDLDAALAFAQYTERLQLHDLTAGSYRYCADLFTYLYPEEPLPGNLYIPWAMSYYHSASHLSQVTAIAERVRQKGTFDLFLEAIVGRAVFKSGDQERGVAILLAAEQRAVEQLENPAVDAQVTPKAQAWFNCFVREDTERALHWANQAYGAEPNSPAALALLAYALVMSEQYEWAKPLLQKCPPNQISELAQARIQVAENKIPAAVATLQSAVGRDPGSLAAEWGRMLLADQGERYTPPLNAQAAVGEMVQSLGERIVPEFIPPDKIFSFRMGATNTAMHFGEEVAGTLTIINQIDEPLKIGPNSLFQGRIRVDAQVKGDLTREFPDLLTYDVFHEQIIPARQSVTVQFPLVVGPLRTLLQTYPQASLNTAYTLYLDPVVDEEGRPRNRLVDQEPIEISIGRPGVKLTKTSLRSQFNALALADSLAKIKTAQLFVGLLREQHAMSQHGVLYRFSYEEWMTGWLTSALTHSSGLLLSQSPTDWDVKAHTLDYLHDLPLSIQLIDAMANVLQDRAWPVRLLALKVLAQNPRPGFDQLLTWVATQDDHPLVQRLAEVLQQEAATLQTAPGL